jgi:hypothetical protein
MLTQMKPSFAYIWIWPFATITGCLAYWGSRGHGHPLALFVAFALLGLVYCALIWFSGRVSVVTGLKHLFLMELAVVTALAINPVLEGMSGILYFLIPELTAAIVVVGWLLQFVRLLVRRVLG